MNDFGVALLELFAWTADLDNFYIDRIANEAFLPTAQLRNSILNLANLIDYEPASTMPSAAILTVTIRAGAMALALPVGSQFSTAASANVPAIVFETPSVYELPANPGATALTLTNALPVVQGVTTYNEAVGTSTGAPSQIFALFNPEVIDGTVQVIVDEGTGQVPWVFIPNLVDAASTVTAFSVSVDANGVFYVVFGNGVNGRIPAAAAQIFATYRTGAGTAGNVAANTIVVDLTMTTLFSTVTNQAPAIGGADAETNDQIRVNAPRSLTALGRCVSLQDYASVSLKVPSVSKASAQSSVTNSVVLYVHPTGGPYALSTLESMVIDPLNGLAVRLTNAAGTGYLDSRKPAGTSVTVLPPVFAGATGYLPVVITVSIHVLPQYLRSQVQNDVAAAISTLLDFGLMTFGALVTQSSVYHACQNVAGVDWCQITEMHRSDGAGGSVGNIQATPSEIIALLSPSIITVTPDLGSGL